MTDAGERDLELGEVQRRAGALFGERADIYVYKAKAPDGRELAWFVVGKFHRDDMHLEVPYRREKLYGIGRSWAEAFGRAAFHLAAGTTEHPGKPWLSRNNGAATVALRTDGLVS